jgi:glycosyltransferase involved in cell wall biosynthesis
MSKVSIGMPVYNGERWLAQAVESILAQTYGDFEFIISDNASVDNTESISRAYAAQDRRIRYYRNPENIGASDNYNAVFRYAWGDYFKWASSNDICAPTFLQRCVEVLDRHRDVVLCYPRTLLFNESLGTEEYYSDDLHLMDDDPHTRFTRLLTSIRLNNVMNGLIRSDALRKTSLIKVYFSSDINMVAELALHGKFYEVPDYLYHRRMDPQTATRMKSSEQVLEHYYPKRDHRMLFQHWKLNAAYISAISRAPVSFLQKLKCYRYVIKQLVWARNKLCTDLLEALQSPLSNLRPMRGK